LIGDALAAPYWAALKAELPRALFGDASHVIDRMQRLRSPAEQASGRAAARRAMAIRLASTPMAMWCGRAI